MGTPRYVPILSSGGETGCGIGDVAYLDGSPLCKSARQSPPNAYHSLPAVVDYSTSSPCDMQQPAQAGLSPSLAPDSSHITIRIPLTALWGQHDAAGVPTNAQAKIITSSCDVNTGVTICDLRIVLETSAPASPLPLETLNGQHGCMPCVVSVADAVVGRIGAPTANNIAYSTTTSELSNISALQDGGSAKPPAVCCHWKNKGWCRYGTSCKFWHPDHKRGIGGVLRRDPREVHVASLFASMQHAVPSEGMTIPAWHASTNLARQTSTFGLSVSPA